MEEAVIIWLHRMDGKHPVFAECCWGNHIRFIIWGSEKGRKDVFSAFVWGHRGLLVLQHTG